MLFTKLSDIIPLKNYYLKGDDGYDSVSVGQKGGADRVNEDLTYHPLLFHLLDVAAVTACLWDEVLGRWLRQLLSDRLGVKMEHARGWLAFWVGLHDLGKATPVFQAKWPAAQERLTAIGLPFASTPIPQPHGLLTAACLPDLLAQHCPGIAPELAQRLAVALGGHHGVFPSAADLHLITRHSVGGKKWQQARECLVARYASLLGLDHLPPPRFVDVDHAFFLFFGRPHQRGGLDRLQRRFFPFYRS